MSSRHEIIFYIIKVNKHTFGIYTVYKKLLSNINMSVLFFCHPKLVLFFFLAERNLVLIFRRGYL